MAEEKKSVALDDLKIVTDDIYSRMEKLADKSALIGTIKMVDRVNEEIDNRPLATNRDLTALIPKGNNGNTLVVMPSVRADLRDYDEEFYDKLLSTGKIPWDTIDLSYVTDATSLLSFSAEYFYTAAPRLINTKIVRSFQNLFFAQELLSRIQAFDDLSNCNTFKGAFHRCTLLKAIPDFPKIKNPVDFSQAFRECGQLKAAPVIPGAISSAVEMFYDCYSMKEVNPLKACDKAQCDRMFYRCSKLETAPAIQGRIGTTNSMFMNCYKLKTVPEYDLSLCSDMASMFHNSGLTGKFPWEIDLSSIESAQNVWYMFSGTGVTQVTFKNVRKALADDLKKQGLSRLPIGNSANIVIKNYLDY